MTESEMDSILGRCTQNKPASEMSVVALEQTLGFRLPKAYRALMNRSNGYEGFVAGNNFIVIWPVEEIVELNDGSGVAEFAPGLVLFGSDGGGTGFAFDRRKEGLPVVEVPFIGMSLSEAKLRGNSFEEFLMALRDG
jgi:hypothetical protein